MCTSDFEDRASDCGKYPQHGVASAIALLSNHRIVLMAVEQEMLAKGWRVADQSLDTA